MRRIFLLAAVLVQVIGTVVVFAARINDCGPQVVTCLQHRGALNVTTGATMFLLFWTAAFGIFGRIGAIVMSGMFLAAILLADVLFLIDGVTGSQIYQSANLENSAGQAPSYLFTANYFIYNGWLLLCIALVAAALYKTFTEFKAREADYNFS